MASLPSPPPSSAACPTVTYARFFCKNNTVHKFNLVVKAFTRCTAVDSPQVRAATRTGSVDQGILRDPVLL